MQISFSKTQKLITKYMDLAPSLPFFSIQILAKKRIYIIITVSVQLLNCSVLLSAGDRQELFGCNEGFFFIILYFTLPNNKLWEYVGYKSEHKHSKIIITTIQYRHSARYNNFWLVSFSLGIRRSLSFCVLLVFLWRLVFNFMREDCMHFLTAPLSLQKSLMIKSNCNARVMYLRNKHNLEDIFYSLKCHATSYKFNLRVNFYISIYL